MNSRTLAFLLAALLVPSWIVAFNKSRELGKLLDQSNETNQQLRVELVELQDFHEKRWKEANAEYEKSIAVVRSQLDRAYEDNRQLHERLKAEQTRMMSLSAQEQTMVEATDAKTQNNSESSSVLSGLSEASAAQKSASGNLAKLSYLDLVKALRDTPEVKERTKERVEGYFENYWKGFGDQLDPTTREEILGMIKKQMEDVVSLESSMWMIRDREQRNKINEEIMAKKLGFRDDLKNKFGQDKLDMFNDHLNTVASQNTIDRMDFLNNQDDKKKLLVDMMVEVKKRNDWDDGLIDSKLMTMNREQMEVYKVQLQKMNSELANQSSLVLNEQERLKFQAEIDRINRRFERRMNGFGGQRRPIN